MATNFQVSGSNFEDTFLRRDLFSQGGLWGSGYNGVGNLGLNALGDRSSPVQTVSGGANWKMIAAGNATTAGIKTDGTLWVWGNNTNAELGDNTTTSKSSPVQTVSGGSNWEQVSIACAGTFHGAIKTDGTLWMWGAGSRGQLGNNDIASKSSPVQTIASGSTWKQVGCGQYFAAAIKTDGTLWTWGYNASGQLGNSATAWKSSPVQTIAGGNDWKTLAAGSHHVAAIKTNGTLWVWGNNTNAELGDNTTTSKSSPVQTVSGGTDWKQVSCGVNHTGAIKTDGTLWLWGSNYYGGLGINNTTSQSSPVQTISGGTNWKQISIGNYNTAAIKTDGTLWNWGWNIYGALGDNTTVNKSSPVQTVAAGTSWRLCSVGAYHIVGLTDIF